MSAPTTYSALKTRINGYFAVDSSSTYAADADLFIDLAEARFNADLKTRSQLTTTTPSFDSTGEASLPTDYCAFYRAKVVQGEITTPLAKASPEWMDDEYPLMTGSCPLHIAIDGSVMRVRPVGTGTVHFTYYATIPALTDSNTTNWLLTRHPGLYLAASMYEAAEYFNDPDNIERFGRMTMNQMELVRKRDINERTAQGRLSVRGDTP